MYKFIFTLLLILIPFSAKAQLEITIYLMRSNTDVATSTTTYDMVDSYQMQTTNTTDFVTAVNNVTGLNLVQSAQQDNRSACSCEGVTVTILS